MDLEDLLKPIDDAAPSGPDLEYDPEWQELERLAQGKPEQQFGDTIIPGEEPDWRDVGSRAEALLARSKDLRSGVLLLRAQTHLREFPGLVSGMELLHQLIERFWETVHPQLDASDGDDPTMRMNALAALSDPAVVLRDVRNARLFVSRSHGDLFIRHIEIAMGKAQPRADEPAPTAAQLEQQIAAVIAADPELPARASAALASARSMSKFMDDKVGTGRSPDMKSLIGLLLLVDQFVGRVAAMAQGGAASDPGSDADGVAAAASGGSAQGPSAANGVIRSRADVVVLLDRIAEFLQRTEPSSPVALLVKRSKRLMTMNFMELMNELAPDGVTQAQIVMGPQEEPSQE